MPPFCFENAPLPWVEFVQRAPRNAEAPNGSQWALCFILGISINSLFNASVSESDTKYARPRFYDNRRVINTASSHEKCLQRCINFSCTSFFFQLQLSIPQLQQLIFHGQLRFKQAQPVFKCKSMGIG
jgi:hypothetical protein